MNKRVIKAADKDIKEITEFLSAVGILTVTGFKVSEDGFNLKEDLADIITVLTKFDDIKKGFEDLDDVDDEVKDLSEDEAKAIVGMVYKIIQDIKNIKGIEQSDTVVLA